MKQYTSFKEGYYTRVDFANVRDLCARLSLSGVEVFMDDIVPRDNPLYADDSEKEALVELMKKANVRRIHCSYWGYPTSFLTRNRFGELVERLGGEQAVLNYFGDLTGEKIFKRWFQEYTMVKELHATSYVFHLIDYAPIDGMWPYTISKREIRQAMIAMLQHFINLLIQDGIITNDSPIIEVENAGFGLEYGMQDAEDFMLLFRQLYDPFDKVRIGWDINHLLHAIGFDEQQNKARFFLMDAEITPSMKELQEKSNGSPAEFAHAWIEHNVLQSDLIDKVGGIHLSDCALKRTEHFTNGRLNGPEYAEICSLKSWEEREEYGVNIVLSEYDSHLPIGQGILIPERVRGLIDSLSKLNGNVSLLHELKNSHDLENDLREQIALLQL